MKKPTNLRLIVLALILFQSYCVVAQNLKPFSSRFDKKLKGDMLLIGNNILNRDNNQNNQWPNDAYNGGGYNSNFSMKYIDVDTDNTTFSSSSATLTISKPACYKIVYAGLYWGAILQQDDRSNIEKVKLKLPTGGYNDITGQIIYDASVAPIGTEKNKAYACYADITALVTAQTNAQGLYTVANVKSSEGTNGGTGLSAGWSIYVVYEDPTLPAKYITSFDGFSGIGGAITLDIPVSGFKTIPKGPVRVKFAFAALEGDQPITGDYLQINGIPISATNAANTVIRAANNFFNSSVTYVDPATDKTENFLNRNPASTNTLGYDAGILNIDNPGTLLRPGGIVINNNETSANIKLGSTQDVYFYYFNAFAVDIIEPNIVLTKIVKNSAGVEIGNQNVTLGQQLNYEVGFKNTGNDDATSLTIRDQLPINIIFNYPADLNPLPAGVTVQSYDAATRSIVFKIDDSVVKANTLSEKVISFKVKVVPDCNSLSEACSNSIDNSAYATYKGKINPDFQISDNPSVNTNTGCILTPKATNFLVDVDGCKYTASAILCKDSVDLLADNGYTSYTWYSDEARTNQIGTGQTLNVKNPGTYYVYNLAAAPCRSIYQAFTVTRFGTTNTNPVIPYAKAPYKGEVVICPNDGKELPNLFLCGANDSRLIQTNISDSSNIVWEKLVDGSCPAPTNANCANEGTSCTWNQVGTGPNFNATLTGQYRLTINYSGGCFNRFYFNVFTNSLDPTETHTDIICSKLGTITVGGVPAGYLYSIDGTNYQASNTFNVSTAGFYTVYIKQANVPVNPCIFTVPNIQIRQRNFTVVQDVTQPLCYGEKGKIRVAVNDANAQYYYKVFNNGNLLYNIGPVAASEYTFDNLNTNQNYVVEVSTDDGCKDTKDIYIGQVWNEFKATAALIEPLTACSDGKIRITTEGGNSPYSYFINSDTVFQSSNEYVVTTPGTYVIKIVDKNNCTITRTIVVPNNAKPTYTITNTNSVCYDDKAEIRVNLTNANGYTMSYSINNGGTFVSNPVFSNLQPGTYNVEVRYGISYTNASGQATIKYCTDPAVTKIIAGPTSAVTASGGVAELAGCTLSQTGGKLRINNAQGGTAPYQYSFDGGATWQATNEKDVLPGSYILKIRDAVGCEYTIPYTIILDPKPADPTIKVEDPVFNCNGTATSKVTVTNGTSTNYTYEYYLDNSPNTPITNNVFLNVPSGSHTVSVKYNVTTVSTYSNLLQEDFGKGTYTTTPGINPAYCFEDESTPHPVGFPCGAFNDYQINDGKYAVASSIKTTFNNSWLVAKDHTLPSDPLGRFLCVNVGGSAGIGGILYSKPIKDVIVNQPVIISLWAENLIRSSNPGLADPKLTIQLVNNLNGVGGLQTIVATTDTTNPWVVPKSDKWEYKELSLNPGAFNNLSFVIRSYSNEFNGNDVLLDDIWVRQIPKSCIAQKDFPIIIDTNKAFTASVTNVQAVKCNGGNTGSFTIVANNYNTTTGFQYSIDGGANWITSTTSPVLVSGLTAKTYDVRVRYDSSATTCNFTFGPVVTTPTALTITAQVTTQPTCTTGATITATASGGTSPYEYELKANGITMVRPFQNSGVFVNVPTGSYTIVTRDINVCASSASALVTVSVPTPPTASLSATSNLCYDAVNKATLVVTATGTGTLTYSLDGAAPTTSNTFANVGPGTHNIVVTDSNNCTAAINNIVIAKELKANATISTALSCTTPTAIIKVDITDGTAPYTYKVKFGSGAYGASTNVTGATFNYTATNGAGIYTFEIQDVNKCPVETSATVGAITIPTVTATPTNITCFGAANGSVLLTGAGGSGGYEYNFNNTGWSSNANYTGLAVGTYSYLVRDSNGCSPASQNVSITQPTQVTGTISATIIKCSATGTVPAVVTIIGAGGTGAYTYSFNGTSNFTSTNTYSTSTAGTVTAYVKDANGCQAGPFSVTISTLEPITAINLVDNGYDCSTTPQGGRVVLTAVKSGSLANVVYQITSGPAGFNTATNTTGNFASLAPGNYVFQARDTNTDCSLTISHTVVGTPQIVAGGSITSSIKCFGSTGTISFTVNGAKTSGYDYVVRNAANFIVQQATGVPASTTTITVATALTAGTYTITATDVLTKCQATYAVTLTQPAAVLDVTATATTVNCKQYSAIIDADATGGTLNYTYAAGQGAVVPTVFDTNDKITVNTVNGTQLNWIVYVKDANGCTDTFPITIIEEKAPVITSIDFNNQCTATSSSAFVITANATGLVPLTYSIDGTNFQTSNSFTVTPGTYTVTVKDKNGCTTAATTPIVVYARLTASTVVKELDCSPTTPNATITVNAVGGRTGYTYEVSTNGGTSYTSMASNVYSTATAGTYLIKVIDANNCQFITSTVINPKVNPTLTFNKVDVSCNGGSNGSVQLFGADGVPGYTYSNDGTTYGAISLFQNLAAGNYTFYVKDSKQCTASVLVTITQPTVLVATATATNLSCSATNTKQSAVVTIAVPTTGTAPYQYSFNGGGYTNTNTLTVNDNGTDQTINYSVRDAKGCTTAVQQIIINKLDPPVIATITATPILCSPVASTTSTVTITATNGVGALTYQILSGPVVNTTGLTSGEFTGLTPGTYSFKVTDINGCYAIKSYRVNNLNQIVATATKLSDVDCFGSATGSIRYDVSGFTTTYSYSVNGAAAVTGQTATVFTLPNLTGPTTYNVVFTDNFTNCTVSTSTVISQPANPLALALVSNVNANCNIVTSTVTVAATGGTTTYQYAILDADNLAATPVYGPSAVFNINSNAGADPQWVIFVKDAKGCVAQLPVTIAKDPIPTVTATVSNQCSASGSTFQIVATGASGVAPYSYTINTGVAPSPANTFTVAAGTYTITVKDANNCRNTTTITVNEALTASAVLTKDISCAAPANATIDVTVVGGKSPFGYRVKIGAGAFTGPAIAFAGNTFTYTPTSLTGTTYQFEISDANGTICTALTNVVTTTTPATVTATAAKVDPTCNGDSNGSITLTATAGVSPFAYSIDNGVTFFSTKVFGGLTAGTYTYVIKDAKGCTSVPATINLVNPPVINVFIKENGITCGATLPGSLDINVISGGTAPYTYYLYDNAMTQLASYTETSAATTPLHNFGGLSFGNYYIKVIDANGCKFESARLRIEPPPYLALTGFVTGATCATGISVTLNVTGGNPNYTYTIYGIGTTSGLTPATSYTFTNLDQNTNYVFEVVDNGACPSYFDFKTPTISPIVINPITVKNVTCYNAANGEVTFTVTNYDPTVTTINYEIRDNVTNLPISPAKNGTVTGLTGAPFSATLTGLKPGNYALYIKEFDGTLCSTTEVFQITQPVQALTAVVQSTVNANCNNPAQVTIKTTGGTGPYTYAYAVNPAVPSSFTSTSNVLNLDPGALGTDLVWNIIVKDANGCTFPLQTTIVKDPSPVIALQVVNKCVAQGSYVVRVSATNPGTGALSISVNGSGVYTNIAGLPFDVTGLNSGSNTISIKDANGCIDTETIIIDAPLVVTPAITALPTCLDNDGVITLSGSGGTNTYTYTIAPMPASVTIAGNVISGLPAGTYTVTMTDTATPTACSTTASVTLIAPTPVTFDAVVADALCNGSSDGSITVNLFAGNNNPAYTYSIAPTPVGMVQTGNVFSNLPQGTYTITVNSGRGCSLSKPYTVGQPLVLAATAAVTVYSCNASNIAQPAIVTVNVTAGTGTAPYQYNFDGSANYFNANTLAVIDNVTPQTIHYYVKDAHGCKFDNTVVVNPYQKITGLSFAAAPITCINTATDVTVTVAGGYAITKYEIIAPTAVDNLASATFLALAPGTYTFQVTDANGCKYQDSFTVKPVTNITVSGQLVRNVTCNPGANGEVLFTVGNFAGTYSYSINGGVTVTGQTSLTIPVTGISTASTQTILVTDEVTGCTATVSVNVAQLPTLTIAIVSNTPANCNFGAKVTVQGSAGTPAYTYAFVDTNVTPVPAPGAYKASPSAVLDANPTKNWVAFVKDANGCIAQIALPLTTDPLPTIDPITGVCYTGAPVNVTLTGTGVGPLQFNIGNGYTTNPNFNLNAPGSYTFYVKDANNCVVTTPYVYQLQQELLLKATLTDLTCNADASIVLTATQGTGSYTGGYEVSTDNGVTFSPATLVGTTFTTNTPGTYIFRVTDSQSCSAVTVPVTVTPNVTPTFTYSQVDVSCNGGNNGSFTIIPGAGTAPFEYSVNGGAFQSTTTPFTGLVAGIYSVVVRDIKLCASLAQDIKIIDPPSLAVIPTITPFGCNTSNTATDAVLTLAASGGTPSGTGAYSYSFDNGVIFGSSPSKTVNTSQTINYVVVDANGCRVTGSSSILPYTPPTDMNITATPIYCNTPSSFTTITVNSVSGGVSPYTYDIIAPATAIASNTSGSFSNLMAGTYTLKVTDANGCSTTKSIVVKEEDKISVTAQLLSDVLCNGNATGSVAFTISNYINPAPAGYTYTLTSSAIVPTQVGNVVTYAGLTAGSYTFTVTDATSGCQASVTNFVVNQPVASLSFTTTKTNINCITKTATITVNATGGTLAYQYAVVASGAPAPTTFGNSPNLVVDTANGTVMAWDVYVKDLNGCAPAFQTVTITQDPLPTGAVVNPFSQCPDVTNGTYTFTISGVSGVGPFQYSIGSGFQASPTFVVSAAGSYTLTVKDANNCEASFPALIDIFPALDLQVVVTTLPNCTINNGVVTATTTGGAIPANYEYSLDGNFGVPTGNFTGVGAGNHTIVVTDLTTGCDDTVTFNIPDATSITGFTVTSTDVTCKGAADGTISASIGASSPGVNDNPSYTYTVMAGATIIAGPQASGEFTGLAPGDYTVVVTSGRGCTTPEDVRINEPAQIIVNPPVVTQFGCSAGTNTTNSATITVNSVTGGSSNYIKYEFIKGGTIVQSSASNVYIESDLSSGSYVVNVYDDKGCLGTSTAPITIAPFISLDDIVVAVNNAITCITNEDITVSVTTTGGTPAALLYSVVGINGTFYTAVDQPTGVFTGLPIGNFMITVTNPATNCSIQEIYYVNNPNTFEIKAVPVNAQICFGATDGSVELTFVDNQLVPTNDAGPFDYIITGPLPSTATITRRTTGAGPITIINLTAGQYAVSATLVAKPTCNVTTVFSIEQPNKALVLTSTQSEITCITGNNDGTISASASGGWPGDYQYELVLGGSTVAQNTDGKFTGLVAGNYTIIVKDSKGCPVSKTATLVVPAPIVVTAAANASVLSCFGARDGIITVSPPTGGQGSNYLYTLNIVSATPVIVSGPQSDPIFTGLAAGTYSITVTDGFSCSATSTNIVITQPTEVMPTLTLTKTQTCLTQSELTLSATGGTGLYTYSTTPNFATILDSFTTSVTFGVPVGVYQYYVRDANGCVGFISNEIANPALVPLVVDLDVTNAVVKCLGEATGVIVAEAKGGLGNYVYTLQNATGTIVQGPQPSPRFEGLVVGVYKVNVTSGDCNATSATAEIKQPATAIQAQFIPTNVSCFGENNGKIEVIASGGTGAIKYAISPDLNQFDSKTIFDKLAPGTYTLIAQDENGCYVLSDVTITQPKPLIAKEVPNSMIPELCVGDKDGSFSIEIVGGTEPYSVSLDVKTGPYTQGAAGQTIFPFTGLSGGKHIVYVKDAAANCSTEVEVIMPEPVVLNPTVAVNYDCVNNAAANAVIVTIDPSNTNPALVRYEIDGLATTNQVSNIFLNVAPGVHYVTAIHDNGCFQSSKDFTIKAVAPLAIGLSPGKPEMNIISVTASGGSPAYEYSFDGEAFTSEHEFKIYKTRDYVIIVRDQNGCTATITVPGKYVDVCVPDHFTPNGDGQFDTWGPECTNIYNNLLFDIYDRYGRVIAKYHYGQKWDGKYNGEELPTGDYWYVLKLNDEKDAREFVGHFTLYR